MRIVWTRLALQDIHCLREYISADNPGAAQHTVDLIAGAVEQLLAFHKMGRPGRVRGTRELVVVGTPFIVPYRIKKDRIEILAVIHASRRWPGEL